MYFYQVERRVKRLIKRLPNEPSVPGKLSETKQDIILSSILLCSAELEDFVEFKILQIINLSYRKWVDHNKYTLSLVSFAHRMHPAKNKEKIAKVAEVFSRNTDNLITDAYHQAIRHVNNNHGLSEKNLIDLLKLVGADEDLLSSEINLLANFTDRRGAIAHKGSKRHGVPNTNSPNIIKNDMLQVLSAIRAISSHLDDIRKKI